jgi:hypothetical protein
LSQALSQAYTDSARYLADAVAFGMVRCDRGAPLVPVPTVSACAIRFATTSSPTHGW